MWDVKFNRYIEELIKQDRFTLTMWDVKEPATVELTFEIEVLP